MEIGLLSIKTALNDGLFWLEWLFGWFDLIVLQKVFYLLSINLLLIGTISFFKSKKKRKKFPNISGLEKTVKTVDLALNPEAKGEEIGQLLLFIKHGGKVMKDYIKSMSLAQWISLAIMVVSITLGIVCVTVPAVGQYEELIYTIGSVFFGSAFIGTFAKGKTMATVVVNGEISDKKTKIKNYRAKLKELAITYSDVIRVYEDIQAFGGTMTSEQSIKYNTYKTQKDKIEVLLKATIAELETEKANKKNGTSTSVK